MEFTRALRTLSAPILSFLLALLSAPLVIGAAKRLKAKQPILFYVEQHAAKAGTPTFGGLIFLFPAFVTTAIFTANTGWSIGLVAAFVMMAFAVLGFLDDYIKIKTGNNLGLKPYQKIIGQASIALIMAFFAYRSPFIGSKIYFPFYAKEVDFGILYIPFAGFLFLALSNCVNLTDGLDGLASSCSIVYLLTYAVVLVIALLCGANDQGLLIFDLALCGALFSFLLFNTNKASIFMGDTGSLGLGGACAAIALFSRQPFLVPIVGIMFVVSGISIIVQVAYYKISHGKRVFLMAPFHHHLEKKGYGEAKICAIYAIISVMMGLLAILSVVVGVYGSSR